MNAAVDEMKGMLDSQYQIIDAKKHVDLGFQYDGDISKITSPKLYTGNYVIDNDEKELGRGLWGVVFGVKDNFGKSFAIKVPYLTDRAEGFRNYREYGNNLEMAINEASNDDDGLLYSKVELDDLGTPFIVMQKMPNVLSDYIGDSPELTDKSKRKFFPGHNIKLGAFNPETDISYQDIKVFASGIARQMAIIHNKEEKNVHGDVKASNILFNNRMEVKLADFGLATTFSPLHKGPRDNIGHEYYKPVSQYRKGSSPSKEGDIASFGSLLYRMFTGKYFLEDEIDEWMKKGERKLVNQRMLEFTEQLKHSNHIFHTKAFDDLVKQKLRTRLIPDSFKNLIRDCIYERISNGESLEQRIEYADAKSSEQQIRYSWLKEKWKEFKTAAISTAAVTLVLGTVITGSAHIYKLGAPDWSARPDLETQVELAKVPKFGIGFRMELESLEPYHDFEVPDKDYNNNMYSHFLTRPYHNDSFIGRMINHWLKTRTQVANYGELNFSSPVMAMERARTYEPMNYGEGLGVGMYLDDFLNTLIKYSISYDANIKGKDNIDIEDIITMTELGETRYQRLKYQARKQGLDDTKFHQYLMAKDDAGKYLVGKGRRDFLKKLMNNISSDPYFLELSVIE